MTVCWETSTDRKAEFASKMSLETVIEKVKARVAAVDPNGPRKVLGVFQFNIKTASGVEQYGKINV